jgi:hypothetical protein
VEPVSEISLGLVEISLKSTAILRRKSNSFLYNFYSDFFHVDVPKPLENPPLPFLNCFNFNINYDVRGQFKALSFSFLFQVFLSSLGQWKSSHWLCEITDTTTLNDLKEYFRNEIQSRWPTDDISGRPRD